MQKRGCMQERTCFRQLWDKTLKSSCRSTEDSIEVTRRESYQQKFFELCARERNILGLELFGVTAQAFDHGAVTPSQPPMKISHYEQM